MLRLALVSCLLAALPLPGQRSRPRVLFLTHSAGFVHPVVKRAEQAILAHAERCFVELAEPMFEVVATQDCAALRADALPGYDAIAFYTTGELPIGDEDKQALLRFVRDGGGFVGIHCATDTFYRFPEYLEMVGGVFDGHPWHEEVVLAVEDRDHPTTFHLGESFAITDEIYQFRDWSRERVHVLLRLTGDGIDLTRGKRADRDHALSWCRSYGAGRVFYTALGHRPEVWRDARFTSHLLAGLRWTLDRDGALDRAVPGADVLVGEEDCRLRARDGGPLGWKFTDGELEVVPGTGDAVSPQAYADQRIHLEFNVPADEGRGNSGLYVQRRYEVQILDSAGHAAEPRECGALYGQRAPAFAASRPAGTWQTLDVWFRAARYEDGEKTANARITVALNGILVHDDVELTSKTGQGEAEGPAARPFVLQDHGSRVRFRNVWATAE